MNVLYIMSGLSFSGKTTLAHKLSKPLNAQVLSYDLDIWSVYKPTLPKDISGAKEWDVLEAKARERIQELLKQGKDIIFDDLSVEFNDREMLRKAAADSEARSLVIYMDVPADIAIQRQNLNQQTNERGQTSDKNMQRVISQLQRPKQDEAAVIVPPDYSFDEIVSQIKNKVGA